MSTYGKTILVIGATGNQGGAVARALRRKGWKVRGLKADIPALRAIYPQLTNLETWLRNQGWEHAPPVALPEGQQRGGNQ